MIVVDTNVIAYFHIWGEFSTQAAQAFEKDPHWVAPFVWRSEFRSILNFYLRKKILGLSDVLDIALEAEQRMYRREYEVPTPQVLTLANSSQCTTYDCEFVVLAQNFDVQLVTVEKKILRAFPHTAISLQDFVSGGK